MTRIVFVAFRVGVKLFVWMIWCWELGLILSFI